jgi:GntR family transcriptional repressor for pyruvate dehydrogenase complex
MSLMSVPTDGATTRGPVAEEIVRHLSTKIRTGGLAAGDRLPTEHTLSKEFAVSRTVVREALARLKSDGLVTSRQGSGVYVSSAATRLSFKLHDALVDGAEVLALFELRQPIEMAAARLAAARRSAEDLALIQSAHEAMVNSNDWSEEGVIADLEFHHAIARATGNAYYADFMAFMGGLLQATIRTARSRSGQPEIKRITIEEHAQVLTAIESSNPEAAALAMQAHLRGACERMVS